MTWTRKQPGQTNSPAKKKQESKGNQTILNLGMGIPSQECDDELVRLGASSFQSGNFVCFYFYFLQDLAAEMLFNKYLTIVFI